VCTSEYMEARLDISIHNGVRPDTVALEDRNCKTTRSESKYLYFMTKLDGCGTKHNTTDDSIIYYNSIFADTGSGSNSAKISRAMQAEFPFKCTYPRSAILSVVSFSPRRKVIYTRTCKRTTCLSVCHNNVMKDTHFKYLNLLCRSTKSRLVRRISIDTLLEKVFEFFVLTSSPPCCCLLLLVAPTWPPCLWMLLRMIANKNTDI
jgi:hypothetical protein